MGDFISILVCRMLKMFSSNVFLAAIFQYGGKRKILLPPFYVTLRLYIQFYDVFSFCVFYVGTNPFSHNLRSNKVIVFCEL